MLTLIRPSQREFRLAREQREMVQTWIGWKARPLLRIRYGSEDDAKLIGEGAEMELRGCICQRVEDNAFHLYIKQTCRDSKFLQDRALV